MRLYNEIVRGKRSKNSACCSYYQKLSIELQVSEGKVMSDKRWLCFILEQILSNAIKYTQKGGVRIYTQGSALVIEDSGIGIRAGRPAADF